jgi:hypothetical protein
MGKKRNINKEDYPMVVDWSNYKNTHTELLCKCCDCGGFMRSSINRIDKNLKKRGDIYCRGCGTKRGFLKKYGVDNVMSIPNMKKNLQNKWNNKTKEEKDDISKKIIQTSINKYGRLSHTGSEEYKEKLKNKYGVTHPLQINTNRTIEQINIVSSENNFKNFLLSLGYKPSYGELTIKLGYKNDNSIYKVVKKYGCKHLINKCFNSSKYESHIKEFFNKLNISYKQSDRKILKSYEIDILIPESNVGFEINGMYWHSDNFKNKDYHINKQLKAKENGINLYHIWEGDWVKDEEIVKSWILEKINKTPNKIHADQCLVKIANNKQECIDFYNENHLEGGDTRKCQINIGLYYQDELVACISFARHKNDKWELTRYSTKLYLNVIDGLTKMLMYFRYTHIWNTITVLTDNCYNNGQLFLERGFVLDKEIKPDYFYYNINTMCKINKKGVIDNKLGCKKIWNCGYKQWILNKIKNKNLL